MPITVHSQAFEKALQQVLLYTHEDLAVRLNTTARDVVIRAAQLTKKADPKEIEKALTRGVTTVSVGKSGRTLKKPKVYYKPAEFIYLIINARQRKAGRPALNNNQMRAAAQKFINLRKSGSGYTAYAAWNAALKSFGGRGFGNSNQTRFAKSEARFGFGTPATINSLMARMVNTAPAIEKIGAGPLQEALNLKAADMMRHIEQKLASRCKAA